MALLAVLVAAGVTSAASARADGWAGTDPANEFPLGPMPEACQSAPDGVACQNASIYYLDQARASLGQPPYALPADFTNLAPVDQNLILTDLDRTYYGLPAIPGLTDALGADAAAGVAVDDDPSPSASDSGIDDWRSNWAGGYENLEAAYEGWMYWDGPGGTNLDCTPTNMSGCWGHRHDILVSFSPTTGPLAMGAAVGTDPSGAPGYATLIAMGNGSYAPTYTYTWASAQADGAGTDSYNPGTPQMTVEVYVDGSNDTVSDSHGQVCTGATCDFAEPLGQPVTLTATPGVGSAFDGWFGACSGTGACTITPDQSVTVVAGDFTQAPTAISGGGGPRGGSGGGRSGRPIVVEGARILHVTTSRGTIRARLSGRHLVCRLSRRTRGRWQRVHVSRCGRTVTYRRLRAGRYRLSVAAGAGHATREIRLRHGISVRRRRPHRHGMATKGLTAGPNGLLGETERLTTYK